MNIEKNLGKINFRKEYKFCVEKLESDTSETSKARIYSNKKMAVVHNHVIMSPSPKKTKQFKMSDSPIALLISIWYVYNS